MARIKHPRFEPGRTTALGIEFIDGFADADLTGNPILKLALLQHGYSITEPLEITDLTGTLTDPTITVSLAADPGTEEFAIVELPDGTVIGDGKSVATLYAADLDGTGDNLPEYVEGDTAEKIAPARRGRKG